MRIQNNIKTLLILFALTFSPVFAKDLDPAHKKKKTWTSPQIVAGVLTGLGGIAAFVALPYCKLRFGSFQACLRYLAFGATGLPRITILPGGENLGDPFDDVNGDDLGKEIRLDGDMGWQSEKKTKRLKEELNTFMKRSYQTMSTFDQDPQNGYCSRRASFLRKEWNSAPNRKTMGAVYILQQCDAEETVTIEGPSSTQWDYHVAPIYLIYQDSDAMNSLVLDTAFDGVLTLKDWLQRLKVNDHHKVILVPTAKEYRVGAVHPTKPIPSALLKISKSPTKKISPQGF